jgi:hypothetical protein
MPVIQGSVSVAGLSVNDNIFSGSQFEYLPYNAVLDFGLNGDANGVDLRVDAYSGQDVLMEGASMSAQNRIPVWPDDYQLRDVAAAGERIKVRVRNTNAAARTIYYALRITPLPRRR